MTPLSRAQHVQAAINLAKDEPVSETGKLKEPVEGPSDAPEDERRVRAAIDKHLREKRAKTVAEPKRLEKAHHPTGGPKQGWLPWLAQKLGLR